MNAPLPDQWIARLFLRFQAIYGNRVRTMWGDSDPDEVREVWADRLAPFAQDIGDALLDMESHYKDFPPTLPQFTDLCKCAQHRRLQTVQKLPSARVPPPANWRDSLPEGLRKHLKSAVDSVTGDE